jgi:predicted RNase H-like HicB family nuclease
MQVPPRRQPGSKRSAVQTVQVVKGFGFPIFRPLYCIATEVAFMKDQLTAVFQKVPEGYIGFVEELPGANAQGDTLEEARSNLQEAVQLVLEANRALVEESLRGKSVIREPLAQIS